MSPSATHDVNPGVMDNTSLTGCLSRLGPEQMNAAMGGGVYMQMMMFFH
jgi:hypothetical protein